MAVHISNRHLDLEPVLGRLADEADLIARSRFTLHQIPPGTRERRQCLRVGGDGSDRGGTGRATPP